MSPSSQGVIQSLPRGGTVVHTSIGPVQVGIPPETIKDTMSSETGVPRIFILPSDMFHWQKGINLADVEFPIYFNFFLRQQKTIIVCTQEQAKRLRQAMQIALFGPKELNLKQDLHASNQEGYIPDLRSEINYFAGGRQFDDLFGFTLLEDGRAKIKSVDIVLTRDHQYDIFDNGELLASPPASISYQATYDIGVRLSEPYKPPLFGVTCLGPSHGFDAAANTSGFIIWLNHNGIMVDPPVNSTEWLEDSNVNPKLIDSIILTHCHADHDAGTFQKILEEGKVTLYTTRTVIDGFLKKYAAFSNEDADYLRKLFTYRQVFLDKPLFVHGGKFRFFYTLHSIPTIGFTLEFQDQTFVYSSDHQGDPAVHKELYEKEVISKDRFDELSSFPWDSSVIYHESGIPPLHTPIKYLNSLPRDIQERTVVYHIARKDFPEETNLSLATFGIENTLYRETVRPAYEETYQMLDVLKHLDFFDTLPVNKVQEFLTCIDRETYRKDDTIINKGSTGDRFYIIAMGNVAIRVEGLDEAKVLGVYEYFGEVALLTQSTRMADIVALTDVELFSIERDRFLSFISGTAFEETLERLMTRRSNETWELLSHSPHLQMLTNYQKTWLESLLTPVEFSGSGTLITEGEPLPCVYIINEGRVHVSRGNKGIGILGRGDFIGAPHIIQRGLPAEYTFRHEKPVKLFSVSRDDMVEFVRQNPGLGMKMAYRF